jgi:Endonuclease/Exonuclease/phosphatase family
MPLRRALPAALLLLALPACTAAPAAAPADVRVATFNASLNRAAEGELVADLSTPDDPQAGEVAEVVQRVRPDVLLINEFDHAPAAVDLFRDNYLERGQNGAEPIDYPHAFLAPSNTGVPSGLDLDDNGTVGGPNDALGFGAFPGQYGMLVLSRYPIDTAAARTFQRFLWKDLPGARLPEGFYSPEELAVLPLSSKSHWDVPVRIGDRTLEPSRPMDVRGSGVFWPVAADPLARLNDASDHHATWVDLRLP